MEKIQENQGPSLNQLECMVTTIEQNPKLFSRNFRIKSPMECHNIWSTMVKMLNSMGPQTGIVNIWKRILYNLIHNIRKKMKNKMKLNPTERRLINLLEFMKHENNESEDHIEHDDDIASSENKQKDAIPEIENKTEILEKMDDNQIDSENSMECHSNSEPHTQLDVTNAVNNTPNGDDDDVDDNDDDDIVVNTNVLIFDEEITIKEELIENDLSEIPIKKTDSIPPDDEAMSTIGSDVSSVSSISSENEEVTDVDYDNNKNDVKNNENKKTNREHEEMKLIYKTFIQTMEKQSEFYKGILDALNENNRIKKDMLKLKIKSYKMKKYAFHKQAMMRHHQRFRR